MTPERACGDKIGGTWQAWRWEKTVDRGVLSPLKAHCQGYGCLCSAPKRPVVHHSFRSAPESAGGLVQVMQKLTIPGAWLNAQTILSGECSAAATHRLSYHWCLGILSVVRPGTGLPSKDYEIVINASCSFSRSSSSLAGHEVQDFHTLFQVLTNTNRYQYCYLAGEELEGQRDWANWWSRSKVWT